MGGLLRVVGVLVILGSCRSISAMVAGNFIERPRQLRVLQLGLQVLETEISYANASLPEALETVARRVDPPVNGIFQEAGRSFLSGEGLAFGEAWDYALRKQAPLLALQKRDLEVLRGLGQVIGLSNKEDQGKHLALARHQLQQEEQVSIEERERNVRLWNYLGLAGGAALVLLFY